MATGDVSVRNKEGLLQADAHAFWTQDAGTLSLFVLLHLILLRILLN